MKRIITRFKLVFLLFIFPSYFQAQTTLFSETFEAASEGELSTTTFNGWKQYTVTSTESDWAISNNCPLTGSYSMTLHAYGAYCEYAWDDTGNEVAYYATLINASAYNTTTLSFDWRCRGEVGYDYGKVCWSTNGTTWTDFTNSGTYVNQATTQSVTNLNISEVDGTSFYLGFRFINDGNTGTDPGFNIDNIVVRAISNCAVVAGTSSASVTTGCGSTSTTLSLAGEGAGSIQWQQSTDGGATWNNIAGATTDPYVHTTSVTRMYRAAVTNGCTSYSTTSTLTISCDIIHPSSGFVSTTINCGASYTYRDPGNTGNYSDNQNGLITLCPSSAGQYINVNFTAFNTESGFDRVIVFDGNNAGDDILGIYSGNGGLSGNVRATSSNTSGCLSFRFTSDGATVSSGWTATVTCNATPSATVPTANPEDCQGAIPICNNGTFHGGTNNYGFDELPDQWNSCLGNPGTRGEYESTWAVFSPATSGTIGFSITPTTAADYDWAIWGPYSSLQCPAFTNDVPIRCSSTSLANTGGGGTTGLIAPAADVIEQNGEYGGGSNENGKLAPLNVLAGQVYVMMLDNWDANTTTFQLNWNLTNGATLDCTPPLPVTMSSFVNTCVDGKTLLKWTTETETNNDYFAIEKSDEKFQFYEIGRVSGNGNSNVTNSYSFVDDFYNDKTAYYRIKQVDYNGEFMYHRIIASSCFKDEFEVVNQQLMANSLDLIINSVQDEKILVQLFDIHGKLIVESSEQLKLGNNKITLDNFNINSGIYLVNLVGEIHHYQNKLFRK
ncbi:MAG: hypothetical protein KFKLKKLM_01753 [Flavobacteriales bacterium]|nr:hypothetical protein [Flavobacteriales bacterium]